MVPIEEAEVAAVKEVDIVRTEMKEEAMLKEEIVEDSVIVEVVEAIKAEVEPELPHLMQKRNPITRRRLRINKMVRKLKKMVRSKVIRELKEETKMSMRIPITIAISTLLDPSMKEYKLLQRLKSLLLSPRIKGNSNLLSKLSRRP